MILKLSRTYQTRNDYTETTKELHSSVLQTWVKTGSPGTSFSYQEVFEITVKQKLLTIHTSQVL